MTHLHSRGSPDQSVVLMYHLPGHAAELTTLLVTRELRWFHDGDVPGAVLDWFEALPGHREQERRTDYYDLIAARTGAGVKYRDGQFMDSKFRLSARHLTTLPPPFSGLVEDWAKISTPIPSGEPPPPNGFVRIGKQLITKRISADTADPGTGSPEAGCEIEIASIDTPVGAAWSLGFESYGLPEARGLAFRAGIDGATSAAFPDGIPLASGYNGGYPMWLAHLALAA